MECSLDSRHLVPPTDFKTLITISLTDGSITTRPTNVAGGEIGALRLRGYPYVWIEDKLFIYAYTSSDYSMVSIYVFNLETLEWKNTGIELGGQIDDMSSADDKVLIVNVTKGFRNKN
ncbi:hypothetical protein M3Y94_00593900 [Aphelenchoides besseyi]|nr:hypothetical protein M3Y94_00593900 [Aphelenchoides besseyi]